MIRKSVQVAGIRDPGEARMLIDRGVDMIGFPLRLNYHRPDLSDDTAAEIVAIVGSHAICVVITYLDQAEAIIRLCRKIGVRWVQLHGDMSPEELARLRALQPEWILIKSLVVKGSNQDQLLQTIAESSPRVDAFITDTFDPQTGASGATGKVHDWKISRRLARVSPRPLILAGGLNPDNVEKAILTVEPAAVDVHTGVEDVEGWKDRALVERFVENARKAFESIQSTHLHHTNALR